VHRISSRRNAIVARFRALARAGHANGRVLIDGPHLLSEALASRIALDIAAFVEPNDDDALDELARRAAETGAETIAVTPAVLSAMSPVRHPAGVVAIGRCGPAGVPEILARRPQRLLIVGAVQDPGNLGAIIRVAEACGASGVMPGDGSADPFGWKAVRGSMGSIFRLPVAARQPLAQAEQQARAAGLRVVAAVPRGGTPLADSNLAPPIAIMLGGEGAGLPDDIVSAADERLTIPMQPPVESLNVAVAAGLILYEAARVR
jgi:TrmH family RNA methyltransferase